MLKLPKTTFDSLLQNIDIENCEIFSFSKCYLIINFEVLLAEKEQTILH